jgi:hypothetical protein
MSGFFSSLGRGSGSKAPKEEAAVDTLTPTSEIYTTPLEGIKPTKKWEYDEEQLKKVSHHCSIVSALLREIDALKEVRYEMRMISDNLVHPDHSTPRDERLLLLGTAFPCRPRNSPTIYASRQVEARRWKEEDQAYDGVEKGVQA